jgi:uncharacterized membrane protein/thiol-disulfide isomerase/thioredoxin
VLRTAIAVLLTFMASTFYALSAGAQEAKVRAVLFYSPTCPHCQKVITQDLPPLLERYGAQLQILAIDTTQPGGSDLFRSAMTYFDVPQDRYFVPALVAGDTLLVGSAEIPDRFPTIVEEGLAAGGIDWPAIPGLQDAINSLSPEPEVEPSPVQSTQQSSPTPTLGSGSGDTAPTTEMNPHAAGLSMWERFQLDPIANGVALAILIGMLIVVGIAIFRWIYQPAQSGSASLSWLVPALSLLGVGVAAYLTYVETTNTLAVCGPVGDCNAVQGSSYARVFGVLPVGLFGLAGYVVILAVSIFAVRAEGRGAARATVVVFGLALFGTLFSIYLTFIEPFVIGATCAWCLASAVLITGVFWLASDPAREAMGII